VILNATAFLIKIKFFRLYCYEFNKVLIVLIAFGNGANFFAFFDQVVVRGRAGNMKKF
jgi:hypothetical protein